MRVTAVNGTQLTVVRGVNGTIATPHVSGSMVLFGPGSFFYVQDPGGTILPDLAVRIFPVFHALSQTSLFRRGSMSAPARSGYCSTDYADWVPGWRNGGAESLRKRAIGGNGSIGGRHKL